jgi:Ca-activated chloride channel family protein
VSFHHFSFSAPEYLFILVVVPAVVLYLALMRRRRARYTVEFTNMGVLARSAPRRRPPWARRLPMILLLLALIFAAAAIARPQVEVTSSNRSASIVLLVDVSDSMQAFDIVPSRLQAAILAMHDFVQVAPVDDKIGLVTFSDNVNILATPTTNHSLVDSQLSALTPQGGTALGDGVVGAVKQLVASLSAAGVRHDPGHFLPAAIVLESDGAQNRGTISPFEAAQIAKAAGVRIYGVALGKRTGVIREGQGYYQLKIPVPPDPNVVALLANDSGGKSYSATSAAQLDSIYRNLGTTIGRNPEKSEITSWFEIVAAILVVAGVGLARRRAPALP